MKIAADGFEFDFNDTNVVDVFVFDEKDITKPTFHGAPMKAVDIIVELADAYIFVEMKNLDNPEKYNIKTISEEDSEEELREKRDSFKWLKNYLKYKYRDSYLFRCAEHKVDKPIHYICLLTFNNALNSYMQKELKRELPVGKASRRWQSKIVESCQVVNVVKWNSNFPKWKVTQV